MDENSCENETSESADGQKAKETERAPPLEDVGIKLNFDANATENLVLGRRGPSFDASVSGPSTSFVPPRSDEDSDKAETTLLVLPEVEPGKSMEGSQMLIENTELIDEEDAASFDESSTYQRIEYPKIPMAADESSEEAVVVAESTVPPPPSFEESQEVQPRVRLAPSAEAELSARRPSVGPPPSYSFVMKQKKKLKSLPTVDPTITSTPPPPTYTGARGIYIQPDERIFNFPSFAEPIWRSHSQPALCPRCGIIVLTTTHTHDSLATHVAALALCLFGCWPCCLLPYCMNVCKNTFHHCPICQTFLGLYRPW